MERQRCRGRASHHSAGRLPVPLLQMAGGNAVLENFRIFLTTSKRTYRIYEQLLLSETLRILTRVLLKMRLS